MHQAARNVDYQHLQEPDLLWTGAILADRAQKDRQEQALRDRDFLLDSTIAMGLYDNEVANSFLEKSMRYTAVTLGARAYGNECLHIGNISGFVTKFFQCSDQIHFIHISNVTSTFACDVITSNISVTFEM